MTVGSWGSDSMGAGAMISVDTILGARVIGIENVVDKA